MKGANKYAPLFETGQYGKLYITSGSHARGDTFHIQVLPDGEKAKGNGSQNTCLNSDAVEVYGIIGGNPGWTEEYGWLHKGKWQDDFTKLVRSKELEIEAKNESNRCTVEGADKAEKERINTLLKHY